MKEQTFPPQNRLHFSWQYQRFYKNAETQVLRLRICTVFRLKNSGEGARLGMSIKTNQGSVVRNRLKRQIRELFRHQKGSLGDFDYNVVVSQKGPMSPDFPARIVEALRVNWLEGKYVASRH